MIDDLNDLIQPCEAYCIHDVRCDQYGRLGRHLEHSGYDWRTGLVHDWPHFRADLCETSTPLDARQERRIIDVELP